MKENIPLQSIDFRRAMQEINESPKERERREKEQRQRERGERREKFRIWWAKIWRNIAWATVTATVGFFVKWLLSKYVI